MKALGTIGLVLLIVLVLSAFAFHFSRPAFPVKRLIKDRQGKHYDVLVVGKEKGFLVVEPENAPDPFEIPIQSLQLSDWAFAHWLPEQPPPPVKEFPILRTITNSDGKSLKVRIIGKSEKELMFERVSDNMYFEIPIERLSEADQRFANRLRNEVTSTPVAKETDYTLIRLKQIEELKERKELYEKEINSQTLSKNLHEKRLQDVANLDLEIRKLEIAIENYRFQRRER